MGQEKTQRENGREQRNEGQGRFGRKMGLRVNLCGPLQGEESGHQQQLTWQGQSFLSLKFWGLVHSSLGLTLQPPNSRQRLPWTRVLSTLSSDGGSQPWVSMPVA